MKPQDIVSIAKKYVGQKELPNNSGFINKDFLEKMEAVGWKIGESWCAYFAELVWKESAASDTSLLLVLNTLFSASAVATYSNFKKNKIFVTSDKTPALGALVIWRHGNGWAGHVGIVIAINGNEMTTIEGNTNNDGSREGVAVFKKQRKINAPFTANGLNLIGFVYPKL